MVCSLKAPKVRGRTNIFARHIATGRDGDAVSINVHGQKTRNSPKACLATKPVRARHQGIRQAHKSHTAMPIWLRMESGF